MLGDLDLMYVDTTLAFEAREEVAAARDRATAMLREEDAILARLREILPR